MFLLRDNIAANNFAFYSLGEMGIFVLPFLLPLPGGDALFLLTRR